MTYSSLFSKYYMPEQLRSLLLLLKSEYESFACYVFKWDGIDETCSMNRNGEKFL